MVYYPKDAEKNVNCRIGSLENAMVIHLERLLVNCRIGSLEIACLALRQSFCVNCRIGSLEITCHLRNSVF